MKPMMVGKVYVGSMPVSLQETVVPTPTRQSHPVYNLELVMGATPVPMTLADIRAMKALLFQGEQRLLLREDQALRSQNLNLDLG